MKVLTKWSVIILVQLWLQPAQAIEHIAVTIEQWASEQLQATDLAIDVHFTAKGLGVTISVSQIQLPAPLRQLNRARMECSELHLQAEGFSCRQGKITFQHPLSGQQQLRFTLSALPESGQYRINVTDFSLTKGKVALQLTVNQQRWKLRLNGKQLSMRALLTLLHPLLEQSQRETLQSWDYDARLNVQANLTGRAKQLAWLESTWTISALDLSNDADSIVAEMVAADIEMQLKRTGANWQWQINSQLTQGQAYAEPVFLDFSHVPLSFSAAGSWDGKEAVLDVSRLELQRQKLKLSGQLQVHHNQVQYFNFTTQMTDVAEIYPVWLQPFLYGTTLEQLNLDGRAALTLSGRQDQYQLKVDVAGLAVADQEQRFGFKDLNGSLAWSGGENIVHSRLSWQQARLYAIKLGQAQLHMRSQNNGMILAQTLDLPILDGMLKVEQFALRQTPDKGVNWSFTGELTPVSMDRLSQALGWPVMYGKLSGVIPKVRYQQQQLTIDGALQVKLFGGTTIIRDLRMVSPLGELPQLYANIDIHDLDLEILTRTFDFGRISGRIDGHVHQLRLAYWQPVYFDASLATSEHNPGRRRISQKAVDHLTQLGGGASGVLSRSFLRFFDEFSYEKLGLKCKLRNASCEMDGVEPAQQGYYIVKGGGGLPPWINVVGYTRYVDWQELLARLQSVSQRDDVVIE